MTPDEVKRKPDRAEGKTPDVDQEYEFGKAKPKNPGGRPTKYKAEYAEQAAKLCALGATDADLADFFHVSIRSVERWRAEHVEFFKAVKEAKETADARVERSVYQRSVGYTYDAVKIFMPSGASEPVYAPYREHCPPDTNAAIFWLKNRQPDAWRDKVVNEHTGKDGGPIETKEVLDFSNLSPEERGVLRELARKRLAAKGDANGNGEELDAQ